MEIYERESANSDSLCVKLQYAKEIHQFFLPMMKKQGIYID